MFGAFYVTATALNGASAFLDATSNNISNSDTPGYKSSRVNFQDLLYQTQAPSSASAPSETQLGLGVRVASISGQFTQGQLILTGNPLDVAINGNGFLQVAMPDGTTAYTRAGNLNMDADGNLVTAQGFRIEPPIVIPADATTLSISANGAVSATTPAGVTSLGQIQLAQFTDPAGLIRVGDTLFTASPASGDPLVGAPGSLGLGTISQGQVEQSNVDLTSELVNLLIAQQMNTFNTQALSVESTMLEDTANLVSMG